MEPRPGSPELEQLLVESLAANALTLIVARRPCILVAKQLREYEKCATSCATSEARCHHE
jgi:hypothetical protein